MSTRATIFHAPGVHLFDDVLDKEIGLEFSSFASAGDSGMQASFNGYSAGFHVEIFGITEETLEALRQKLNERHAAVQAAAAAEVDH